MRSDVLVGEGLNQNEKVVSVEETEKKFNSLICMDSLILVCLVKLFCPFHIGNGEPHSPRVQ